MLGLSPKTPGDLSISQNFAIHLIHLLLEINLAKETKLPILGHYRLKLYNRGRPVGYLGLNPLNPSGNYVT
jgi:hypothetical protein